MYLRGLEMQSFKFFPDKISLDFDKGITAVVGPNGSGKSNIGDAMRWVMGEQSSKTLRGGKMEDVIFAGTEQRKSVGFAQVTLTIDNTDKALSVDSDIVRVSRKLYRNGDSEYIINGENVRLKDIVELFMDTGLGRDGYSIIGQGRIAEIVSSKSTDRREIFEEAAGISKFRYKKEEAERKLVAAEDNISRITDILSELESRLGPLKTQSEKAKKFIVIEEEKRGLEISVWVQKLDNSTKSIDETNEKLTLVKSQYEVLEKEVNELDDKIQEAFEQSAACEQEIQALHDKIHQTELENTQATSKIAVCENDIEHIRDSVSSLEEQIEAYKANAGYLDEQLAKHKSTLEELMKKLDENKSLEVKTEEQFSKLASNAEDYDKELQASNDELSKLYLDKSSLGFKIENNKNIADELEEKLVKLTYDLEEGEKEEQQLSDELKAKRASFSKLDDELSEHKNKLSGFELLLMNKAQKLEKQDGEIRTAENELIQTSQRLNILKDLESNMEGFAYSVKSVLKAKKQGRLSGICGSVAQLVTTKQEYNLAIETALGGTLQYIVTEDENAAKRGIKYLKESKAGRATFLPLTSIKGSRLDANGIENEEGFVAVAADIVTYDSKYDVIIKNLLGRVCIAENIDLASNIAKKYNYRFKICTLDGQVINAGGSFTGGSASKTTGILSRKNEIDELTKKRSDLEKKFDELKSVTAQLRQECANLSAQAEGEREVINTLSSDSLKLDMEIKRVCEIRSELENKLDDYDSEIVSTKKRLKEIDNETNEAIISLGDLDKLIAEREGSLAVSKSKLEELRVQREGLTDKLSSVRIEGVQIQKDIELTRSAIDQTKEIISNSAADSNDSRDKINELNKQIADKQNEIERIRQELKDSVAIIKEIEDSITAQTVKKTTLSDSAEKLRSVQRSKLNEKETLQGQLSRLEEGVKNETAEFDRIVAQLYDNYELTRSQAQALADMTIDVTQANKRLSELRSKIKALGNVNLASIEEYQEVSERFEKMTVQLDDVNNSKLQLVGLIDELTEKMKEIFTESFDEINRNFKAIFVELFGGGRAELILADPENVLECGIDIRVAPPGKVIKNLVSLSGGEQAFVAIAIYFAILKLRPSPFCLLDEIEAALDDVNVSRYAQYLHRFTEKTQFIAITHRRGTMEEADMLYGVTMQKGISKLLRMSPDEAYDMEKQT